MPIFFIRENLRMFKNKLTIPNFIKNLLVLPSGVNKMRNKNFSGKQN